MKVELHARVAFLDERNIELNNFRDWYFDEPEIIFNRLVSTCSEYRLPPGTKKIQVMVFDPQPGGKIYHKKIISI